MLIKLSRIILLTLIGGCLIAFRASISYAAQGRIPDVYYLKSEDLTHLSTDFFNPPAVTNFQSQVQTAHDVMGYINFTAPPLTTVVDTTVVDKTNARLFIKEAGGSLIALNETTSPVTYTWYPNGVIRTQTYNGLIISTIITLAPHSDVILESLTIKNTGAVAKNNISVILQLFSGVAKNSSWGYFLPKANPSAETIYDTNKHAFIFHADGAYAFYGTDVIPSSYGAYIDQNSWATDSSDGLLQSASMPPQSTIAGFQYSLNLSSGQEWKLKYVHALHTDKEQGLVLMDDMRNTFDARAVEERELWNTVLKDAFTSGNKTFSGHLPTLSTSDPAIERMYYMAAATFLGHRRIDPDSVIGTTYVYYPEVGVTVNYLWDMQFFSPILAQLDPVVLRSMLEDWMKADIHRYFYIDYISGNPGGLWYGPNDYALFQSAIDYLRYTGDWQWLDKQVGGKTVLSHLEDAATHWKTLGNASDFLGDYGKNENLLEVVPTYINKIASLNAANVWMNRQLAQIYDHRGDKQKADMSRVDANNILQSVLTLYVSTTDDKKGGFWKAKVSPTTFNEVRHIYDFDIVLNTIPSDLQQTQKDEMVSFFTSQLQTPTWLYSLSPQDPVAYGRPDEHYDGRPDQQDTGGYVAWPSLALLGLFNIGRSDIAMSWLSGKDGHPGLASITQQGPFGQAYVNGVQNFVWLGGQTENGTAAKVEGLAMAWSEAGGAQYAQVVEEGIFGMKASLYNGLTSIEHFGIFDKDAVLYNVPYQGKDYTITKTAVISPDGSSQRTYNINDYLLIKNGLGSTNIQADFNHDGKIDIFDFNVVVANFGK